LLQAMHQSAGIEWPPLIQAFVDVNWLYFSFLLFVFTCATIWLVSQFTAKASPEQLAGLTYSSVSRAQNVEDRQTFGFWEIFHTCVIAGIIVGIYIYFW
jgi:SSS family solute:Na+ symporter